MAWVGLGGLEPPTSSLSVLLRVLARAAMVDEALEVLTGMWTGQPFSHHGRHFQVSEMTSLPPPVQQPRIPIWIGDAYPNPGRPAIQPLCAWSSPRAPRGSTRPEHRRRQSAHDTQTATATT